MKHVRPLMSCAAVLAAAVIVASCDSQKEQPSPAQRPQDGGRPAAQPLAESPRPLAQQPQTRPAAPPRPSTVSRGYSGPLPPLPRTTFPPPRPPEVVEAVYAFAARHPEVLHHVPCFCGCESHGHVGNDDCFVASRDAEGRPTWDTHGMG